MRCLRPRSIVAPIGGRDNAWDQIEWEDAFRACIVAIDVERDAHRHQRPLRGSLPALDLTGRQRIDHLGQRVRGRARGACPGEHLVEELFRIVVSESHRTDLYS